MTSAAKTFDPFAIQRPVLRIGDHGEWTLGDVTEQRQARLAELGERFQALIDGDDPSIADVARIAGELCEAACERSEGLADLIVGLCDSAVHGDDALGARAIVGLVEFVGEWLSGESSAGND
jgi:hypothetical protein